MDRARSCSRCALIVSGIIGVFLGLRPTRGPGEAPVLTPRVATPNLDRTSRLLLLGGLGAGVIAWLVTGWMLAVIAVRSLTVGLPMLLSAGSAASRIERLEAMEEWTRSLFGVLTVGVGLEQHWWRRCGLLRLPLLRR